MKSQGPRARVKDVLLPSPEAVRIHLDSILRSTGFVNSERMSRFLRYTVEMKLRGEEGQIKEFLLGQEVFDRGADYDPRLDPIVRVEARRLRQRLGEYYETAGGVEPFRIEFPKGSYAPVIEVVECGVAVSPARTPRRIWIALLAGLVLLMAGAGAAWVRFRPAPPLSPMAAVIPASWVWKDTAGLEAGDEALAEAVTAQLANQGRVGVVGWPVAARSRGVARQVQDLGRELGVAQVILVSVRREGGRLRVTVFQLEAATGRKSWVNDYFADGLDGSAERDRVAREIAAAIN